MTCSLFGAWRPAHVTCVVVLLWLLPAAMTARSAMVRRTVVPTAARMASALQPAAGGPPGTLSDAHGDPATIEPVARDPHVRVEAPRLRQIVDAASIASPTLRALIAHIESSDVVAYVSCDMRLLSRTAGRLSFVGSAAGTRYVQIQVGYIGASTRQAALIGHELQHAVEVADSPAMIDTTTFDREYARIGFLNAYTREDGGRSYETTRAIRAGEQILRELRQGTD